jgi:ABC-type uncharacterized transport system permease subunit
MFNPSRDQVRQFFFRAWAKYQAQQPLVGLESQAVQVMVLHPEYHETLTHPEQSALQEYPPESGEMNPFLHLSLHLAIEEQLALNQPKGICKELERLMSAGKDRHQALHVVLECLGEMVWQAQRQGGEPDAAAYLERLRRS